ncbi:MAG: ABC transporter ATP-binding protein, partial [Ruminococcus sp.]|nr:ABC transporter ATP-binding protein [Ruminococcus sp.]
MAGPRHAPPGVTVEKPKNFKKSIGKLIKYMAKYKLGLLFVFLFAVGSTVFAIVGPKVLARATDALFTGLTDKIQGTGGIDFEKIGTILLILLGLYFISAIMQFIQGLIMANVSQKVSYRLRKDIAAKINRLPMNYFDKKTNGEVLSRVTNDVDTLGMSLNQSVTQLITSITTIIGVLIMMLTISPTLTLVAIAILPVSGIIMGFVMKHSQKYFKQQQE